MSEECQQCLADHLNLFGCQHRVLSTSCEACLNQCITLSKHDVDPSQGQDSQAAGRNRPQQSWRTWILFFDLNIVLTSDIS